MERKNGGEVPEECRNVGRHIGEHERHEKYVKLRQGDGRKYFVDTGDIACLELNRYFKS